MKLNTMVLATGLSLCCQVYAQTSDTASGIWDYQKMEKRVRQVCAGPNGNMILRMAHPKMTVKALYRNWTDGDVFTESFLNKETADKVMAFTQGEMLASESCYSVSHSFLRYELVGFDALRSLRNAFDDSEISENCRHVPAEAEAIDLYGQCSNLDVNARYVSETGQPLFFHQSIIELVHRRMLNKLLIERRAKTCDDIVTIDEELYTKFAHAHRLLKKQLKKAGIQMQSLELARSSQ